MGRIKRLSVLCVLSLFMLSGSCMADLCEFATVEEAKDFGWELLREKSIMKVVTDSMEGGYALKVAGQDEMGLYGGIRIRFPKSLNLAGVKPEDKISFYIKQDFTTGFVININGGGYYRDFRLKRNEWTKVELEMDIAKWETKNDRWEEINWIEFYSRSFDSSGKEMLIDGLTITVGGQEVKQSKLLPLQVEKWVFPYETDTAWFVGNDAVSWGISKKTGEITGGWNVKTKENYLSSGKARYYLEDRKSSWKGQEEDDAVSNARFDAKKQEITLKCTNLSIPGVEITKRYRLDGTRLGKETTFGSSRKDDIFITFNTEVYFDKGYRKDSYYMGAGFVGPLIPAPQVAVRRRVTEHQNTTKSMILSQPVKRYSFAHYRVKLDDKFVFPWWTNSIIGYTEEFNMLFYTPNGWEMSMGTSKIPAGGMTSCEEHFQIFGGDWYDFYTKEYPSLAEVKKEMDRVPPVPEWMKEVIADASGDYKAIKRLAETTDSGYIMVLLCTWGSWADYYVNEGLVGYQGGFITGQELKEHIQSLQAISPRVKVGIYTWMASASYESRIFAKHPEWFRQKDKQGNPVYLFPGVAPNYSSMINRKDCYDELLRQYDLIFDYLNLDFIYIDEGRNHNAINWATGDVSRDDHFYEFYLDVNKTAKKYGPEKVFFLNGRGNLYADVNYIEARGQLRAGYWRNFAGMGLGMEAMLKNLRPEARIIPLFWTPPLARDYVNRTIALGWIPATQYVDEVAQRPFITAAYEIGNLNTVKIDYSPDWKKDTATNLESYPMRRATGEYLLSFINNEEKTKTFDIKINLNTLKLDKNRNITVWGYRVANALEFKGQTSEKVSREIYRKTGWKMDLVAEPELLYLGKYTNDITLKIPLNPLELTVLEITDKSAGLYSVEGLPCNFYLAGQKGIKLTETASGVMIDSDIEEAEILLFVPKGKEAKNIKVDKRSADYELVDIAGNLLPVLKVNKGAGQMLEVALADAEGNVPAGKVRKEQGEKPAVKEEDLGLTPKKVDRIPEAKEITPVNRTVKGVKVLNKAVHMGSTTLGEYQLKLKPFTATVDIDNLVLEAGTTRKITENQGPAFAGIEMEGVKRIELRLANTYTGSFHLRGPRMHTHQYAKSHNEFAGFIVDYHTAGGYTKRVALGVGVMDPELNTNNPGYGKHSKPDALFNLGDIINESREKILTIDLTGYAPEGWDGKAWFSVGSDAVAADRRLTAEILNVNDKAKAASLTGTDPGAVRELFLKPKSMTVPKASPSPVIDGVVDEEIWQSAVVIDQFFLVGGENWPKAKTRAVLLYDNDYLYAGFTCEENSRKVPITGKGNIWDGDEVEILIDVNDDAGKTFHQIIVNAIGEKLELTEGGAFNGGTKVMATREEGRSWTVEIAIPFKGLGLEAPKSGDKWRFNLARYRPAGKDFENELIVWSSMEGWFLEFEKMGELIFK